MSNIQTYLQQILDAVYGEEVRGSIHDAIATMNTDLEAAIRDDLNPLAFKGNLGESGGTNNNLNNCYSNNNENYAEPNNFKFEALKNSLTAGELLVSTVEKVTGKEKPPKHF